MGNFYRGQILVSKDVLAKLGQRTLVGATQEEIWYGTTTTRPTPASQQLRLISTSVEDKPAGLGIVSVRIEYLDPNGLTAVEIINLNGLAAVLTVATNICAIIDISAQEIGTSGGAVGVITVTNTANTVTYEKIQVYGAQVVSAIYVVPARKKFFLTNLFASSGSAVTIRCKSNWNPATGLVVANGSYVLAQFTAGPAAAQYTPSEIGPIPAGARIWLTAQGAATPTLQGTFEGYQAAA